MGKVAILTVYKDRQQLRVSLIICPEDDLPTLSISNAKLDYPQELESYYTMWKSFFHRLQTRGYTDWEIDSTITTQRSNLEGEEACQKWVKLLESSFSQVLAESPDYQWRKIREQLTEEIARNPDDIRVIIKADPSLWKLPWHRWDLLEKYPQLGLSFSLENYGRSEFNWQTQNLGKVRILAVFGDQTNLNLEPDREAINSLEGAQSKFLEQPTAQDFINELRDVQGWDILFFAGHSQTQGKQGIIYLNETEKLEISQFRETLRYAIEKGLKIAIFNSCEGSGLAEEAAKLQLPTVIFMQEKVPDSVAQYFLKQFLTSYARESFLTVAFRYTQTCLEGYTKFPGVTWLPKLYQNPSLIPPTWQQLKDKVNLLKPKDFLFPPLRRHKPKLKAIFVASLIVTSFVMGIRFLGWLQSYELSAYDDFLKLRPQVESPDPRITIITNDAEDIEFQKASGMELQGSLSNQALFQVLDKLQPYQPKVIGLDIFRDRLTNPEQLKLQQYLDKLKIFFICNVGGSETNYPAVNPPPNIPTNYLGFSNIVHDPDNIVRRQIIGMTPSQSCPPSKSFSYQLAEEFLGLEKGPEDIVFLRLNQVKYTKIEKHHTASYHQIDDRGFTVILNYRAAHQIAQTISLKKLIEENSENELADLIKDKIILIGTIDASYGDYHSTPFSKRSEYFQETPGIMLQAEMISQLISAVQDNRAIIQWFPQWIDTLFVWLWAIIGGFIIWCLSSRLQQQIFLTIALVNLSGLCFFAFDKQGYWLPFIPASLALILTGWIVINLRRNS